MKKIKLKIHLFYVFLILLIGFIYLVSNTKESFTNIKKPHDHEQESILPILRLIYQDIQFVNDNNVELILTQKDVSDGNTKPYIFMSGEANKFATDIVKPFYDKALKDKYCVAAIVTTEDPEYVNEKTFYVPMFLNRGHTEFTSSPFFRKYTNNKRDRLAAYIATHSPKHRDEFFKVLSKRDDTHTTDGLGKANHTRTIDMPGRNDGWWKMADVYKDYKFGFAMENTEEEGYITEKIMNVFIGGAIPIYWGTSKVKEIFNPDAFIYVNEYPSFEDAAKDIVAISKDLYRLKNMLEAPIFLENCEPDYSSYYDIPAPLWVRNIADKIKRNIQKIDT